jgi:hypothetical protein
VADGHAAETADALLLGFGLYRQLEVDRTVTEGGFVPPDPRVLAALTGAAAVLGVLTVILLFSTF